MCLHCREEITLGCQVEDVRSPKTSSCSRRTSKLSRSRRSPSSTSRSSGSLKYSTRYSRSLSLSSCRWVKHFMRFSEYISTPYISIKHGNVEHPCVSYPSMLTCWTNTVNKLYLIPKKTSTHCHHEHVVQLFQMSLIITCCYWIKKSRNWRI